MRWIIAVILSAGLAVGSYFGSIMWNDYCVMQGKLAHLRVVQKDLETVKRQYDEQAKAVVKANALWSQIQQVGLEPKLWVTHPLKVTKTVPWDDFVHLILLSANTYDQTGGYWFKPERLRVVRVTEEGEPGSHGKAPAGKGAASPKQIEQYDASFEGKFLIRKQ